MTYKRPHSPSPEDDLNKRQRRDEPPHAVSQAPRAAPHSNSIVLGPTSSEDKVEEIIGHFFSLLGACNFDFKADIVSYAREGLFVRIAFATSSSGGRIVDLWRTRKPLGNGENMLTIRLATALDTAVTAMSAPTTASARDAAIKSLFPKN